MLKFVSKNGITFIIRGPKMSDAEGCLEHINELVKEDAPIIIDKKVTLGEERAWLREQIARIKNGQTVMLLAEKNGEIVSICELIKRRYRMSHVADLGISVKSKYRRIGLAEAIFREALKGAEKMGIEIVRLCVYEDNEPARALYAKLGFKPEATMKDEIKCDRKYKDVIVMSLYLGKLPNH